MAYGKKASKPSRPANRALSAPLGMSGQRRANAIDSIVTEAQKGGAERQSGYKRPR